MNVPIKTALAAIVLASLPMGLVAAPHSTSMDFRSKKEIRKAEAEARTADDHLRLAAYYESKAQRAHSNLTYAEDLMKRWNWMAGWTKVPNAYASSRDLAERSRLELEKASKLAADHQRMVNSIRAGVAYPK